MSLLCCSDGAQPRRCREISQRLEHCFEAPLVLEENILKGSASFGIALYPEDGATKDNLLNVADAACTQPSSAISSLRVAPPDAEPKTERI